MSSKPITVAPDTQWSELHNDASLSIKINGLIYKSITHFIYASMMPSKFTARSIIAQRSGDFVRKKATLLLFGKKVEGDRKLANASEAIILEAIRTGYEAFFNDNPKFQELLLGTRDDSIVYIRDEPTFLPGDITVLGLNRSNNGQNQLGVTLQDIRESIRKRIIRPVAQLTEIEKFYRIVLRHKLLNEQLEKGHFPSDYSLRSLYSASRNINSESFEKDLKETHHIEIQSKYYDSYRAWKASAIEHKDNARAIREAPFNMYAIEEYETGSDQWISIAYENAIVQNCVLVEYLNYLNIDYETLLISVAKKKILQNYQFNRKDEKNNVIPMKTYLQQHNITKDTLYYIGEESLRDLRVGVYNKYILGVFEHITNFADNLIKRISALRGQVFTSIKFPQYTPVISSPSKEFLKLIAFNVAPEPEEPTHTYGGIAVNEYYAPVHPNGACSENPNDKCEVMYPGGRGSDDDEDVPHGDDEEWGDDMEENSDDENDSENEREYEENNGGYFINERSMKETAPLDNAPIRRYVLPQSNVIRFSTEKDYPYGWMSPYFIHGFKVQGAYYPSVAHYVLARLGTPRQFRNESIRTWIQRKGEKFDSYKPDPYTSPSDYKPVTELVKELPERLKHIYNRLYIQYANISLAKKYRVYPFRQILASTKGADIVYRDEYAQPAFAGGEIANILMKIRDTISDVEEPEVLKPPPYEIRSDYYQYMRNRTLDMITATVHFAKYRMSPHEGYHSTDIPIIGFTDARVSMQNLYPLCDFINYNSMIIDYPKLFYAHLHDDLTKLIKENFPDRTIYGITSSQDSDSALTLSAIAEGKFEGDVSEFMFVDYESIARIIWIHVSTATIKVKEEFETNNDTDDTVQKYVRTLNRNLFNEKLGNAQDVARKAVLNILRRLRIYYQDKKKLDDSEVLFILNFLYPSDYSKSSYLSGKDIKPGNYSLFPNLDKDVSEIFDNNEQDPNTLNKLAWVLSKVIRDMKEESDNTKKTKLVIRVKFFAMI